MKPLLLLAPLALAGCATLFGPTSPFAVDRKGELVEFNYAWSAEASAVPALVRRLDSDLETTFNATAATAQADRAAAQAAGRRFTGHQFNRRWTTAGQSPRLLSLAGETLYFTGAPYPRHGSDGLLWDRLSRREIGVERLFTAGNNLEKLVRAPFCVTLDGERAKRRGVAMPTGDAYTACPKIGELAVLPADSNADDRFDRIRIIAPPGVVGASEGRYDIAIPVTAALRAAISFPYRSSFEVQPQ